MHYLKLATLFVLPIAFALTLGAAPQQAEAGLCKKLGRSNGCVTSGDVKNNNLKAKDIKDEPGVEFNNRTGFGTSNDLSTTWADMQTLSVTHPATGFVVCTSMGFCDWNTTAVNGCQVGWSTTAGNVAPPVSHFLIPISSSASGPLMDASAMYTFAVSGAGTTTFRLKASIFTGATGSVDYFNQSSVCMYFAQRY